MTQLIIIAGYLLLLLALGLFANRMFRGTSRDYMLASNTIGPVLLLMSLFGTTMTAFALVGSTGKAFQVGVGVYGMLASASGILHSLCFFVVGVKLWRLGQRHGYTTQIQFFRDRLECPWIGFLLFPVLVGLVIPYLLIGVIGAGAVITTVSAGAFESQGWFASSGFGLPSWLASLVICLVVLLYVFFGGMRGTAWANTFQTAVFMVLGVITFVAIANNLGGQESFLANLQAASAEIPTDHVTREKIPKSVYFSFLLIPLSVAMFPHVFQHWLTARSAETFKLPIVVHPIFIMIVWVPCVLVGAWAAAPSANMAGVKPNDVLATMVQQLNNPVLAGLLSAGILAAIMSSLDSQFLCIGTMFTNDIILANRSSEQMSEGRKVVIARVFVVCVVAVTYALSLFPPPNVFPLGIWCFSGFTGLFPLVLAALYWPRLTKWGAAAGIASMFGVWGYMLHLSDYAMKPYSFPGENTPLLGGLLPPLMPVVTITAVSTIVLVAVSLLTPRPSQATLQRFFRKTN